MLCVTTQLVSSFHNKRNNSAKIDSDLLRIAGKRPIFPQKMYRKIISYSYYRHETYDSIKICTALNWYFHWCQSSMGMVKELVLVDISGFDSWLWVRIDHLLFAKILVMIKALKTTSCVLKKTLAKSLYIVGKKLTHRIVMI